jgi:hypothetical protein
MRPIRGIVLAGDDCDSFTLSFELARRPACAHARCVMIERVLAMSGSAFVGAGGAFLGVGAVIVLSTAMSYIEAGGLHLISGGFLLATALLGLVLTLASLIGLGMAMRKDPRFLWLSAPSGGLMLVWAGFAAGSATRAAEFAWLLAVFAGTGLLLMLGWWLIDRDRGARA